MERKQKKMDRSLVNAKAFLDERTGTLTSLVDAGIRTELDAAVIDLSVHTSAQADHTIVARGATQTQKALRTILVQDHMRPIARVAALYFPQQPELSALRMPRKHLSTELLVDAATAMARAAQQQVAVFIHGGLAPDFAAQLFHVTDAISGSVKLRDHSVGVKNGATSGLRSRLTRGRKIIGVLNSIVKKAYRGDAATLRTWKTAIHVYRSTSVGTSHVETPAPAVIDGNAQASGNAGTGGGADSSAQA